MRAVVLLSSLLLAGCAVNSAYEPPVVDTRGREQTFLTDQSDCINQARVADGNSGTHWGAPVTECMRAKGYAILVPKG